MIKKSKRLIFFGNERLATGVSTEAPLLQSLIRSGYKVQAVVVNNEEVKSRRKRQLEIGLIAHAHGIPILSPKRLIELKQQLQSYGADAGILAAYGKIVPEAIINLFPSGIINVHPSLLPLHRGPTPIESVILSGETKTGVSIMSLAKAMDEGAIYGQAELPLNGSESKQELVDNLLDLGRVMLVELLPDILNGKLVALPQDNSRASYDELIDKSDGLIDWSKESVRLEREIRAYVGWPQSRTILANQEVIVTRAHAVPVNHSDKEIGEIEIVKEAGNLLAVKCKNGYLYIERLKPAGRNEMKSSEFLAGYDLGLV